MLFNLPSYYRSAIAWAWFGVSLSWGISVFFPLVRYICLLVAFLCVKMGLNQQTVEGVAHELLTMSVFVGAKMVKTFICISAYI